MNPTPAVQVNALTKRFGTFEALRGLELTVPRGAFYAFLGPNGAGKSTTLGILTGLYAPDEGRLQVLGEDLRTRGMALRSRVGVVPEELALFERLTGRQHLIFCARMFGLEADVAAARTEELLVLTELTAKGDTLIAEYSKGMRRRLAIAAALIHGPELVFLDEPFEGIDVLAAGVVRELLRELSRQGVTLVLTTHVLEIAERLATHAGFIQDGRMLDEGAKGTLLERHQEKTLEGVFEKLIAAPVAKRARLSFYARAG